MADPTEAKRILEAALLSSPDPVSLGDLKRLFDGEVGADTLKRLLIELSSDWNGRAVELVELASGWRFQTRPEMQPFVERLQPEKPPRYSRAVLETLAIVAYRQPVTRGDIEDVRGVTVDWERLHGYGRAVGAWLIGTLDELTDDILEQPVDMSRSGLGVWTGRQLYDLHGADVIGADAENAGPAGALCDDEDFP